MEESMVKVLIVDDEKIERNGIKFLLQSRKEELEITEAANGKEALEILKKQSIDILFTDIKMPFMNGIELVEKARDMHPDIEMVIFSGYGEFEYAKQALQMGVGNYVLKPIDPDEFHKTFDRIIASITHLQEQKMIIKHQQNDLEAYYLGKFIYQGTQDFLTKINQQINTKGWKEFKTMLLIESKDNFFEMHEETALEFLKSQLNQKMEFLNLSPEREICFLKTECDYKIFAMHMSEILVEEYGDKFYIAVGRKLKDIKEIPDAFKELDMQMDNKFYHKNDRIFYAEEKLDDISAEQYMNDTIDHMIEDIRLKDIIHLWEHFNGLKKMAQGFQKYSQIYTKFLFFNVVKELYIQQHLEGHTLEEAIQSVYEIQTMDEVLLKLETMIVSFEQYLCNTKDSARNEIERAKSYIYAHYNEDISVEILAEQVFLSPGYFSYIFKKHTGQSLSRFVKEYRIEHAKRQLEETNRKIVSICQASGFSNVSYFCKSFREYYGCTPEQFRKGEFKIEKNH
jgi:two-component system response regulator YesN